MKQLLKVFDKNNDNVIDYDEFLRGVAGQMNNSRVAVVKRAFQKLDEDGSGAITLQDVKKFYDASKHPEVK